MAVYFKYKSAKDYDSIPVVDEFISVGQLKQQIFESKRFGRGKDFDLIVTNAQSNQDYVDQHTLIRKNTSVLIRRVAGLPRLPIVISTLTEEPQPEKAAIAESIANQYSEDVDWHDFGDDVYAIQKAMMIQSSNIVQDGTITSADDVEIRIEALIDAPATRQFSNDVGFERKKPPAGYVCHRCKAPGHFIQHCPTKGDPNYDIKPKPKSMSSGDVGVPSSTRSVSRIPPELYCPLCKQVMKDSVLASKCCFNSFCDKCINDYIMTKSVCVCGAKNILANTLLPNMTLRDTITRIVESNSSCTEHGVSTVTFQETASSHKTLPKESAPLAVENLLKEPTNRELGNMRKRKKASLTSDMNMSSMNPTSYYPHWTGMQHMSYGVGPTEVPIPFGGQGVRLPYVQIPQGGLAYIFLPQGSLEKFCLKRKREMSREVPSVTTC